MCSCNWIEKASISVSLNFNNNLDWTLLRRCSISRSFFPWSICLFLARLTLDVSLYVTWFFSLKCFPFYFELSISCPILRSLPSTLFNFVLSLLAIRRWTSQYFVKARRLIDFDCKMESTQFCAHNMFLRSYTRFRYVKHLTIFSTADDDDDDEPTGTSCTREHDEHTTDTSFTFHDLKLYILCTLHDDARLHQI